MLCLVLLAIARIAGGAPFAVESSTNLRIDAELRWSDFSTTDGTPIPNGQSFVPTDDRDTASITTDSGASAFIENSSGTSAAGALFSNSAGGSDRSIVFLNRSVQGFGAVFESLTDGPASVTIQAFDDQQSFLFSFSFAIDGPTFLGVIDPDARIDTIAVAGPVGGFAMGNPALQLRPPPPPAEPAINASVELEIAPADTYLHRGLVLRPPSPATDTFTEDHDNAHALADFFPQLRPGDMLLFERLGASLQNGRLNPLLAVLTQTEDLGPGEAFNRVPTAIDTGLDYPTPPITSNSSFDTPTNIPQDFIIGNRTLVPVPSGANFVFFSKATPAPGGSPLSVRVSHIQRTAFLDWIAQLGLFGELARPDSDVDGDGLSLLQEFALGRDPTVADSGARDFSFAGNGFLRGDQLRMTFGAARNVPVRYIAEFSDDLSEWERAEGQAPGELLQDGSAEGRAVFAVDDPNPGPTRFGRIIFEYLPPVAN